MRSFRSVLLRRGCENGRRHDDWWCWRWRTDVSCNWSGNRWPCCSDRGFRQCYDESIAWLQAMVRLSGRFARLRVPFDAENLFLGFDGQVVIDVLLRAMYRNFRCLEVNRLRKGRSPQQ